MIVKGSGKPLVGSKKPGSGGLFIFILLFILVIGASVFSGGLIPVDPNGPGGPPSLPPYFGLNGEIDNQKIILPSGALTPNPKQNLQLKTFKVNTCMDKVAVDFLIDTSGSFAYDSKMDNMKNSLRSFSARMSNMSVIGMQTFSQVVLERVPLDYFKNQKVQVNATIDGLKSNGNTRTRDGFVLAQKKINEAITENKFPGYHYVLVLLTDGVPEVYPTEPRICEGPEVPDPLTAPALRCFAREQDPRYPTNIPAQLKASGVDIYSIGIYSPNRPSDAAFQPQLERLLQEVASVPYQDYYFSTIHGANLDQVLDSIFTSICQ